MKRTTKRAKENKVLFNVRIPVSLLQSIDKFCGQKCWTKTSVAEKAFRKFILEN